MGRIKSEDAIKKVDRQLQPGRDAFSGVPGIFQQAPPVPMSDEMASKVLQLGTDDCNRLLVLRSVGYSVDLCPTVEEFHSMLHKRADAGAVIDYGRIRN